MLSWDELLKRHQTKSFLTQLGHQQVGIWMLLLLSQAAPKAAPKVAPVAAGTGAAAAKVLKENKVPRD